MKCPKCGYHSFEHLDSCKKCGQGLIDHKAKYNLRGFLAAGATTQASSPATVNEANNDAFDTPDDEPIDFGFDFLDEDEDQNGAAPENASIDNDKRDIGLDQPFGVDSERLPTDAAEDKNKSDKGPEFAF